jgi:hypothetical protein
MNDLSSGIKVAVFILVLILTYLTVATFAPIPATGVKLADMIVPYLLGIVGVMVGYYWGSSSKGGTPTLTPVQVAAVEAAEIKAVAVVEEAKPVVPDGGKKNV